VTFIGSFEALGFYKERIYDYFTDCEPLIGKLKNKDTGLRDGFEKIAEFYIENCK